jgi:hypothetical protein
MLSAEEIVSKLVLSSGLGEEEIRTKINQKMESLSGLISEEGAGHIVANELGVQLFQASSGTMKINELKEGVRNVDVVGKVRSKFEVREFTSGARQGQVGNFMIDDETGSIRVTAWNEIASKLKDFETGDVVKLKSGYIRLNNRGFKELHLNDRSSISVNPPGVEVGERKILNKKIAELSEEDSFVELVGHVVNVFDPTFFEQCPECRKRPQKHEGKFICLEHGEVSPNYSYVVNVLLDDGSGTLRATCWKDVADSLFGSLEVIQNSPDMFDSIKNDVLGSIVRAKGGIRRNSMTGNLEMNVREVKKEDAVLEPASEEPVAPETFSERPEPNPEAISEESILE